MFGSNLLAPITEANRGRSWSRVALVDLVASSILIESYVLYPVLSSVLQQYGASMEIIWPSTYLLYSAGRRNRNLSTFANDFGGNRVPCMALLSDTTEVTCDMAGTGSDQKLIF